VAASSPTAPYARRLWLAIAGAAVIGMIAGFAIAHASGTSFHPAVFAAARGGGGAALLVCVVAATLISAQRRRVTIG
jgi:uncharacterized membrane protein